MIWDSSTLPTLVPGTLLVSPHSTLFIVVYTSMYYMLTYFAGSFGRYNVHAKVFWWLMTVYPTVTVVTGFQFANLLPYLAKVVPTKYGYYIYTPTQIKERIPLKRITHPIALPTGRRRNEKDKPPTGYTVFNNILCCNQVSLLACQCILQYTGGAQ
ncbi:hypothetical protein DSO57_1025683 [Entomophthora muscae]|uniref:Uncharacterized protein n=1 Tax=Entomophthora muscae TaxID=34485 RepID=A0ACC2U0M9_9FUNG|nr:hypothetical protein DSO57_1025683 [Entomophthora muscae]